MLPFKNYTKYAKYTLYASIPFMWYYIGTFDKQILRNDMYNRGRRLSQRFKPIKAWDKYVEPMIVRRFSIIFSGGNSFIKGLLSDNEKSEALKHTIAEYKHEIKEELDLVDNKN